MKNLIIVLFSLFSLVGCNLISENYLSRAEKIADHNLFYDVSFEDIPHDGCIGGWLENNMEYVKDLEDMFYWLNPSDSFYRGYDDCTGFSMMYMNIAYVQYGQECSLIFVNSYDLYDTDSSNFDHVMIVDEDGFVVEPRGGARYGLLNDIRPSGLDVYSFGECFIY